ncbi:hypothetical protein D9619_002907 [Psilocybe cf. subviscida]|uniref:F-box domain-containing protein n=1 Tax=Psilocybe cf. subviscida TaxID=2480587 RepID=A0A8H5EU12_9AGAR|nr:hypothetical protein D9619_002907 [Psilocybe cf. subviscida]
MSQSSIIDNALSSLRRRTSLRDSRLFRSSSKDSIKSTKSAKKQPLASYKSYSVYEQTMFPTILRDPDATNKLLEAILDSPNGRRSLSRLARTCRALAEPALDILWRDLDSLIPIIGLFPAHLLKKTRKPGLGLTKAPREEDWNTIIKYSERIQRIAYDETLNNVAASIFATLAEHPNAHLLPRLRELTWKVETAPALDRCTLFLGPSVQFVNLEIGSRLPKLNDFLINLVSRTDLKGFSFISPTNLPDTFTEILASHRDLEKVVLVAPGALAPGVGRWVAALPQLKNLQLDLTGRAPIAVEGFFDELLPRSGDSTPSSIGSRDSGVFSGEELDFTEIRKSALRLTGDLPSKGSFAALRRVQLTGEVANIAVFLKHLDSALIHLELAIEDPPDNADWQDLSELICERFSESLQSIRITATASSRFADLVRSTSRAEPPTGRLSLEKFVGLHKLTRLEIDVPESVVFTPADIAAVASACPNLEILKLCPLSRFPPPHSPKLTLESLAPLMANCRYLHTLAVVFNALSGNPEMLTSKELASPSLLRLHAGHSWANEPLQISILLSHFMPRLEVLKWFQEKNRAGFVELHAKNWQTVSETLPHLQAVRAAERAFAGILLPRPEPPLPPPVEVEKVDQSIDATVQTSERSIFAQTTLVDSEVQCSPVLVSMEIQTTVQYIEMSIDATPPVEQVAIEARPATVSASITTAPANGHSANHKPEHLPISRKVAPTPFIVSAIIDLCSFAYRIAILPVTLVSRIMQMAAGRFQSKKAQTPKSPTSVGSNDITTESIALESLQARQ